MLLQSLKHVNLDLRTYVNLSPQTHNQVSLVSMRTSYAAEGLFLYI